MAICFVCIIYFIYRSRKLIIRFQRYYHYIIRKSFFTNCQWFKSICFFIYIYFILSSSKELTSWVKLQVEIFCKASRRRALQKICAYSLIHDVNSLEDDNVFVFCVAFFLVFVFYIVVCVAILVHLLYNK